MLQSVKTLLQRSWVQIPALHWLIHNHPLLQFQEIRRPLLASTGMWHTSIHSGQTLLYMQEKWLSHYRNSHLPQKTESISKLQWCWRNMCHVLWHLCAHFVLLYFFLLSNEIPVFLSFLCNSYCKYELFIIYMYGKYYFLENDLLLSFLENVLREVLLIKVFCISPWFHGSCSLCLGWFCSHTKFK